jgi:hypothetical protein
MRDAAVAHLTSRGAFARLLELMLLYAPAEHSAKRYVRPRAATATATAGAGAGAGGGDGDGDAARAEVPAAPTPLGAVGSRLSFERMSGAVLLGAIRTQPALVREWWSALPRAHALHAQRYIVRELSPVIIRSELGRCRAAMSSGVLAGSDGSEVEVRASAKARTITAKYTKDECALEVRWRPRSAFVVDAAADAAADVAADV